MMKLVNALAVIVLLLSACEQKTSDSNHIEEMEAIKETLSTLFVATDQRDWDKVESTFSEEVILDYSSMSGQEASTLSPKQIIEGWKTILPGFTTTHHQLGNFILSDVTAEKAHAFCYGTATHYLEHEGGNVWIVVGSYDFDLEKKDEKWTVSKMTFNFKYQDGNTKLPEAAMNGLK
ncbi:nuclear transport factor 2 family protein [Sediminitomix flava]|uniref:SnoaL-like protein n=1 Tax=Sediminitomix flava TaxID=379075 RepID=A0A315ZD51_SEDFL|nr:nuclear transport factor 2 family protein [Sediminitomix flava]PWJ43170.1 SnoaL-like protein [Sediminitomix flava]